MAVGGFFPVVFPAKIIKKLFEKSAAIEMFYVPHAGDKTVKIALTFGGKLVGGIIAIPPDAFARYDEPWVTDRADERHTLMDVASHAFIWVQGEAEIVFEKIFNNADVA